MNDPIYEQMYLDTEDHEHDDAPARRDVYVYLVAVLFAVLLIAVI